VIRSEAFQITEALNAQFRAEFFNSFNHVNLGQPNATVDSPTAGQITSIASLFHNDGSGIFTDLSERAGILKTPGTYSLGVLVADFDNDGWPDIFISNGHVYPEMGETASESGYRERKVVYRNLGNGKFADVSTEAGPGILETVAGRGCAFGDFDNDGDLDVLVNCVNEEPQLLRCDVTTKNNWLKVKTVGVKSNRSGIGARIYCTPAGGRRLMDEVRSGGSYNSQSDLRVHFGLGPATEAEIEIHWPSGVVDRLRSGANRVITVVEGKGGKP
jgi:hypothetical protein